MSLICFSKYLVQRMSVVSLKRNEYLKTTLQIQFSANFKKQFPITARTRKKAVPKSRGLKEMRFKIQFELMKWKTQTTQNLI